MDEQPKEKVAKKKGTEFFKNYGWIIVACLGVMSILFLLGTVVTVKLKIPTEGDEVIKKLIDIHLWDYFKGQHAYDWTMYVMVALLALGTVCICLQRFKKGLASAASMLFILGMMMGILSREFYASNEIEHMSSVSFGWGSNCSVALSMMAAVISLSIDFSENPLVTREIAENGILIAAAFILNIIRIPLGSTGGSVNFQMLPLFVIALRHGPARGLVCGGIIYGLLTCLTDGYGFACYPFDYLVGFGGVMVMGFFRNLILSKDQQWYNVKGEIFLFVSALIATFIRFAGSTASSMIIYKLDFVSALTYNALYIPISGLIAIAAIMAAYGPLAKIHHQYPVNRTL